MKCFFIHKWDKWISIIYIRVQVYSLYLLMVFLCIELIKPILWLTQNASVLERAYSKGGGWIPAFATWGLIQHIHITQGRLSQGEIRRYCSTHSWPKPCLLRLHSCDSLLLSHNPGMGTGPALRDSAAHNGCFSLPHGRSCLCPINVGGR